LIYHVDLRKARKKKKLFISACPKDCSDIDISSIARGFTAKGIKENDRKGL
jgi:hypothetical protein